MYRIWASICRYNLRLIPINLTQEQIACMEEKRNTCGALLEKPEGKRPLRRPRCRWEDNITMNLAEMVRSVVD
jgi:hypothetical protein